MSELLAANPEGPDGEQTWREHGQQPDDGGGEHEGHARTAKQHERTVAHPSRRGLNLDFPPVVVNDFLLEILNLAPTAPMIISLANSMPVVCSGAGGSIFADGPQAALRIMNLFASEEEKAEEESQNGLPMCRLMAGIEPGRMLSILLPITKSALPWRMG